MIVIPSSRFTKKASKLSKKIKGALALRIQLFMKDPYHTLLNNHPLQGSLRKYGSINITGDYRLVYEVYDEDVVRLIDIDTHSNLYDQ